MICEKRRGGLGQLNATFNIVHQFCEGEKLCQMMEKQSLGEDGV